MMRSRAVVGLSLLNALLLCAYEAPSASALVTTAATNTTTVTCVKDGSKGGDFKDAHCEQTGTPGKEEFKHQAIGVGSTTKLDATNLKVTNETKSSEPIVIKGTIGLAKVEIECSTMVTDSPKSEVQNLEPKASQHTFEGFGTAEFSSCNVKQLTKCAVFEPIVAIANFHGVEGLEGPKGEKNAMGVEFVGAGAEKTFGSIEFINKGAEACSLNKTSWPVKGSVVGTSGPTTESAQNNKHSGATIVFTPKFNMQTLKLGSNAAEASFITTPTGVEGPPISITTTT